MAAAATLLRALAVWLLIMAAESVQGAVRRMLVGDAPELAVRQAAVGVSVLMIFAITWLCLGWMRLRSARAALAVGALWALLTLAFEVSLGLALGLSWDRIGADYDLARGGLMPVGLVLMALTPWLARLLISIKAAQPRRGDPGGLGGRR